MRVNRRTTKAALEVQILQLTSELARAEQRNRSLGVLLQRAEEDRNRALGRLASCAGENKSLRGEIMQLRAAAEAIT